MNSKTHLAFISISVHHTNTARDFSCEPAPSKQAKLITTCEKMSTMQAMQIIRGGGEGYRKHLLSTFSTQQWNFTEDET